MIALGLLFLRLPCDRFKPRQQLEAEILVLRHQLNILHRARGRPHLRWVDRALFVRSLDSVGPQGHHDHPARDRRALASCRLSPVLALEIPIPWRSAAEAMRIGPARSTAQTFSADVRRFGRLNKTDEDFGTHTRGKADIGGRQLDVCFVPKAAVSRCSKNPLTSSATASMPGDTLRPSVPAVLKSLGPILAINLKTSVQSPRLALITADFRCLFHSLYGSGCLKQAEQYDLS
jgi:hypothetical protein